MSLHWLEYLLSTKHMLGTVLCKGQEQGTKSMWFLLQLSTEMHKSLKLTAKNTEETTLV